MLITLADWVLDVDIELTMQLSAAQAREHCSCAYCRNFYKAVDGGLPSVRSFLMKFGIDLEGPDELCPFEPTIYEVTYIVQGNIIREGTQNLRIDGIPLRIHSSLMADISTEHPEPYFTLTIGLFELPWLLTDSMDDVVSPANNEEYLIRMQTKLLQYSFDENLH